MLQRLRSLVASPRGPLVLAALAVLISLPALRLGFQTDDHLIAMQSFRGEGRWFLFGITTEQAARREESGRE
jgi:hypothetical protein